MLTSEMIRAARALLRWEQKDLSEKSGVSIATVKRLETVRGELKANAPTIAALRHALEAAGVVFLADGELAGGGAGVRLAGKA